MFILVNLHINSVFVKQKIGEKSDGKNLDNFFHRSFNHKEVQVATRLKNLQSAALETCWQVEFLYGSCRFSMVGEGVAWFGVWQSWGVCWLIHSGRESDDRKYNEYLRSIQICCNLKRCQPMAKVFVACHHYLHLDLNHYLSGMTISVGKGDWWDSCDPQLVCGFKQLSFISDLQISDRGGSVGWTVGFLVGWLFQILMKGTRSEKNNWKSMMIFQFQNKQVLVFFCWLCFNFHELRPGCVIQVLVGSLVVPNMVFFWMKLRESNKCYPPAKK